jgi:UTP--glucose-1-phosphate uridylyltransferase
MPPPVRKAVFPVAGLGTRFLPATRALPKEMLTIVDRPLIQYAVDEARAAGVEHFIFVTGRNKSVIEDHFDAQPELEEILASRGKIDILKAMARDIPPPGAFSFVRQQHPLGLGHAVWCAREIVGSEPFAVLLPDMLMRLKDGAGCLPGLARVYERTGGNLIAVEECDPKKTDQYGIVATGEANGDAFRITGMVEKPKPADAPSNLYINGRYIFQPEIFEHLSRFERGAGGEIQLTDAMLALSRTQPFWGWRFQGETFDCGSKLGFLAANVAIALDRQDTAPAIRVELDRLLRRS